MPDGDVVERLARFGGRLRERGVGVTVSDEIDGTAALLLVDFPAIVTRSSMRCAPR